MKLALLVCCLAFQAMGAQITGHVRLVKGSTNRQSFAIVYAESLNGRDLATPGRYQILQRDKTFVPQVIAVPAGSTVSFPNLDRIFHNVFSLSTPAPFDLGLYRAGSSKSLQFNAPATYRIFCNIHPQMTALLLVLPTSSFTQTDAHGDFRLDLTPGNYRVTAWSERSQPVTSSVSMESATINLPEITLDESKFVEAPHQNKYGLDYPRSAYAPVK